VLSVVAVPLFGVSPIALHLLLSAVIYEKEIALSIFTAVHFLLAFTFCLLHCSCCFTLLFIAVFREFYFSHLAVSREREPL
jgi:hypothetical protein